MQNINRLFSDTKWNQKNMKECDKRKSQQSKVEWDEVKCSIGMGGGEGGGRVFMEKVYRSSKWWEVKDWGESVSELMIG